MIMVQETETVCHDIITNASQQFHIYQGADQLILRRKSTFEPCVVKIQEEFSGTSKQDSFDLRYDLIK